MADCDRCGRSLDQGRKRGHCHDCRRLCPQCGQPNGRKASSGYCAACQRDRRRSDAGGLPVTPQRGQRTRMEPGLRNGQVWFQNPTPEQRLPIQHITLDVERTVRVLTTFYTPSEFRTLVEMCLNHTDIGVIESGESYTKNQRDSRRP